MAADLNKPAVAGDPAVAYLLDEHHMLILRRIQSELHGGTDRERDFGHRLWYVLNQAEGITQAEIDRLQPSK